MKAPKRAELCFACYEMLNPRERREDSGDYSRENSFEEFKEAALQKCAICSLIWNLTDEHPLAWSQFPIETWVAKRYKIDPGLRIMYLYYFDPVQGKRIMLNFKFIRPEGKIPQTLPLTSFLRRING